jgi:hypothetical protein
MTTRRKFIMLASESFGRSRPRKKYLYATRVV